jgi:hypothetical protein
MDDNRYYRLAVGAPPGCHALKHRVVPRARTAILRAPLSIMSIKAKRALSFARARYARMNTIPSITTQNSVLAVARPVEPRNLDHDLRIEAGIALTADFELFWAGLVG